MWSSRLFWKLFASYTILNLLATITIVVIVSGWQTDQIVEQIKQRLHDSAALVRIDVAGGLDEGPTECLQNHIRDLGQVINTRITLVAMDGSVLADSNQRTVSDVVQMENHKDRLELVQAAKIGRGSSQRVSPTLGQPMLYVALRIGSLAEPVGLVRTALPMTTVLDEVAAVQGLIWLVAIFVSLAVAVLTWFLAARVVRPVQLLTTAAERIATGEYRQNLFLNNRDELDGLAKSFNRMAKQLNIRETQLRESSRRLVTVLEGMFEGVIALDGQEKVVLANAAAGRLLGFDPVEATGRPLLEVARNRAIHEVLTLPADQQTQYVEIELDDDRNRVVGMNAAVLSSEHATRWILVLHDVTELRRLESLRQEFVANVSHELKTPLSSIKAYAETLRNGALNDTQNNRRFVAQIDEQAERLHELILDLLSIARIESGQRAFDIGAVMLCQTAKTCIAANEAVAVSKKINLVADGSPTDLEVKADEEGLRQILNNLIDNAIKYSPISSTVNVLWHVENATAVIQVSDTGQGIAPEFLPRVFERFFRVDKARSRALGGTGLGLSIVKHLAQSFGGSVDVRSQVGTGTVFTVRLPIAED
ncbi:MAG: ATP-binding protein [Fuerstiella sp.]|nr:ATP-binding protein [Fuerstiella sp.]